MNEQKKLPVKKMTFLTLGLLVFFVLAFLCSPPEALSGAAVQAGSDGRSAMRILGITFLIILWWVGEVFADWLTTIMMMVLWILVGKIPFTEAFSSFASSSVWLIVGAFSLSAAVTKTGFFHRISNFFMRLFSPSFGGQVLALFVVGILCSPLIPSSTAKAILGASIAVNIADSMGYAKNSRGRTGIFMASWFGFSLTAPAFLSGGIFNYTLYGVLPDTIRAEVTWTSWFLAMIPWLVIISIGGFLGLYLLYKPSEKSRMTKADVQREYNKLGKMSVKEKEGACILFGSILLWILESKLGVNAAVTALLAAFLCYALHLLEISEISSAVPWGLIIFLGGVLNLGNIFTKTGIDLWLQGLLKPVLNTLSNKVLLIAAIIALVLIIRIFLASQSAVIVILMTILSPVVSEIGIHPFVVGLVIYATETCWFLQYQNVVYAPAYSVVHDKVTYGDTIKACVLFEVVSALGFLVSIPYWGLLGYL